MADRLPNPFKAITDQRFKLYARMIAKSKYDVCEGILCKNSLQKFSVATFFGVRSCANILPNDNQDFLNFSFSDYFFFPYFYFK